MSEAGSSGSKEPEAKRMRRNSENDRNDFDAALDNQKQADICKLVIDCLHEVFDYLTRTDLMTVGKTCKFLNQIAGHFFSQKYSAIRVDCDSDEFKCFPQFIRKIYIESENDVRDLLSEQSNLRRLKRSEMYDYGMTEATVKSVKGFLDKVECFDIDFDRNKPDIFNMIIDSCPNLKQLWVRDDIIPIRKYPNLEELITYSDVANLSLVQILELNPNIRKLHIKPRSLIKIGESMKSADIALDDLVILVNLQTECVSLVMKFVNELYDRGRFKRLFVEFFDLYQDMFVPLNSINNILVGLSVGNQNFMNQIPVLENVTEIHFTRIDIKTTDILSSQLPNLKRIHADIISPNSLLTLTRRTATLEKVMIGCSIQNEKYQDEKIIDLRALNEERRKLANDNESTVKMTIYVQDDVYSATKMTMKGGTKYSLVSIERAESIEWKRYST